jgi:hypothetical protein
MSSAVSIAALPENALLQRFVASGDYTDCFVAQADTAVALDSYVEAFYTTTVFRAERFLLRWLASLPSTDDEAGEIARGERDSFAAWNLVERSDNQLLMMDVRGQTCSWFMVVPGTSGSALYFGSAVMRNKRARAGRDMKWTYKALLGFHKLYSRVLLGAARSRIQRLHARTG